MAYHYYTQKELETYAGVDKFANIALQSGLQYMESKGNLFPIIPYEVAFISCGRFATKEGREKVLKAAQKAKTVSSDYNIKVCENGFSIIKVK